MAKRVTKIPATLNLISSQPLSQVKKRRTAGYARVSTDSEEQATSYETQMAYYKNYIESRSDWEFVGMYSDEGISATNTKRRDGFKQMINDALDGKIDLIITKSVSRFARNTVDSLQNVRKLKEKGVEIYFEKENVWTLDAKGELLITIMSSLAQEESRSISENTTWGKRKQFAEGKVSLGYKHFLGYDKDFKINEEEAKIVRLIYRLFITGLSYTAIAKELEKRGFKTTYGKDKWHASTIKSILTNEKYKGDALLQKEYTTDFLQKTRKVNEGEIPQYYVEDHHLGIISPEQFEFVQLEIDRRKSQGRKSGNSIFSSKIKCGCCGAWYGEKVWHSNTKYRHKIYRCNKKYKKGEEPCNSPTIDEEQIKEIFLKSLNSLTSIKKEVKQNLQTLLKTVCNTADLERESENLKEELIIISKRIEDLVRENAMSNEDQVNFIGKEERLRNIYNEKFNKFKNIDEEIKQKKDKENEILGFIKNIDLIENSYKSFDKDLWTGLVDYIEMDKEDIAKVIFKGGTVVKVEI